MITKIKFIRKIFLVYIFVLIPILLASLIIARRNFLQIEAKEKMLMRSVIERFVGELDNIYFEFQNQASTLGERVELAPSTIIKDMENTRQALRQINLANVFNGKTEDIFIYYGIDKIYSAKGLVNRKTYFNTTLSCIAGSSERALSAMVSDYPSITLLHTKTAYDLLMYHFPIRKYYDNYSSSVQFIVSLQYISNILENYVSDNNLCFRLIIGNQEIIFKVTSGECTILEKEKFIEKYKSYIVLQESVSSMGVDVELYFDPKASWEDLWKLQTWNVLLLIISMTISIFVSFLLSYKRWERFQKLTNDYNFDIKIKNRRYITDYDYIRMILEQFEIENEQIKDNNMQYRQEMVHQIATLLFHGLVTDIKMIKNMAEICGQEFTEEYYFLCGMMFDKRELVAKVHDSYLGKSLHYMEDLNGKTVLVFLKGISSPDIRCDERIKIATSVFKFFGNKNIICRRCVFSQVYSNISLMNCAYLEVSGLIENPLQSEETVDCWDNYIKFSEGDDNRKQIEQIELFMSTLETRNYEKVEKVLQDILSELEDKSMVKRYYIYYGISQAIILTIRKLNLDDNLLIQESNININTITQKQFEEKVLKIVKKIFEKEISLNKIESAIDYVNANYQRYDLSLEEMANVVGMNKTQLSKSFKTEFGQGYLEYLTKLRMNKAAELLQYTDLSVKNIIPIVGYADKHSFARKFKAYYGMSPTEYRNQMREEAAK